MRLNHPEMAPGDPCPESGCEGHLHQLGQPNAKIYVEITKAALDSQLTIIHSDPQHCEPPWSVDLKSFAI